MDLRSDLKELSDRLTNVYPATFERSYRIHHFPPQFITATRINQQHSSIFILFSSSVVLFTNFNNPADTMITLGLLVSCNFRQQ